MISGVIPKGAELATHHTQVALCGIPAGSGRSHFHCSLPCPSVFSKFGPTFPLACLTVGSEDLLSCEQCPMLWQTWSELHVGKLWPIVCKNVTQNIVSCQYGFHGCDHSLCSHSVHYTEFGIQAIIICDHNVVLSSQNKEVSTHLLKRSVWHRVWLKLLCRIACLISQTC